MFTAPQEKLDNKLRALVYRGRTRPLNNRDLRDMEAVLKQGANPNARESKNISILQSAMSHRVFDAAQLLIKYGADCHATNSHGNNALTQAISQGRKGLIKTILDHDKDVKNLINTHNSEGKSPLHYLLYRKDCYDLIPELIKYTHPLHHGYIDTALWMAHENAYDLAIDMLQTCIQADTKNTLPGAPLLLDKIKQNKEEGKKTARSYCRQDILKNIGYFIYSAHHNNDTDTLKTLFDHVVTHDISVHDLKVSDDKAVYPLSIALVRTDTELCKTALKFKDIDHHINEKGTETLFKALTNSQEDFAIVLIKNGVEFDGIIAASDVIALGAIRALQHAGKRVPEDVAVVGYDNISFSRYANPALTTVDQDMQAAGRMMLSKLLDFRGPQARRSERLATDLIVRESCGG